MIAEHGGDIFAIARERGWDWRDILDLSASINPLGPSPRVREAICSSIDRIVHYPEREPVRLRQALAHAWNIDPDRILLGNGAAELIDFIARDISDVTLVTPTFSEFLRVWPSVPRVDWNGRWPRNTRLVITNPNNPLGEWRDVDPHQRALLDESFIDFTERPSAVTNHNQDLIVLRSLTKFHALPGLRIGAVVASPDRIRRWRQHRPPWQINVLAEAAALAALKDTDHAEKTRELVKQERQWLYLQLRQIPGVYPKPSEANYMLVELHHPAAIICNILLDRKIILRRISDHSIRIAVRTRPENERFVHELRKCLCS